MFLTELIQLKNVSFAFCDRSAVMNLDAATTGYSTNNVSAWMVIRPFHAPRLSCPSSFLFFLLSFMENWRYSRWRLWSVSSSWRWWQEVLLRRVLPRYLQMHHNVPLVTLGRKSRSNDADGIQADCLITIFSQPAFAGKNQSAICGDKQFADAIGDCLTAKCTVRQTLGARRYDIEHPGPSADVRSRFY